MDETIARAELPSLDIEITHRRLPDEDAEYLAISFRAAPSFGAVGRWLDAQGPLLWPWLGLTPLAAWTQLMRMAWAPWLTAGAPYLPERTADAGARRRASGAPARD